MLIESKKLVNLKVETESGQEVGKISGFGVETDSQSILNYTVSPTKFLIITGDDLIINRGQVVGFIKDKMIVEDNIVKQKKAKQKKATVKKAAALPAMSSTGKK